jgi:hypothetical protein
MESPGDQPSQEFVSQSRSLLVEASGHIRPVAGGNRHDPTSTTDPAIRRCLLIALGKGAHGALLRRPMRRSVCLADGCLETTCARARRQVRYVAQRGGAGHDQ